MNASRIAKLASLVAVVLLTCPVGGKPQETEPGMFFDDFADGTLDAFGVVPREQEQSNRLPLVFETVRDEGRTAVRLKGNFQTRVFLQDRSFDDFALTVNMKKTSGSYAGIVVRDHWRVYFQMKGYVCVNSDLPGLVGGLLFQSDKVFTDYHTLKVVCAIPRQAGHNGALYVYVVNRETDNPVSTQLMLWGDVWDWTKARDVFNGCDMAIQPRDEEGYLSVPLSLEPGQGLLIETDALVKQKQ